MEIKYIALILLTIQNVSVVMTSSYVRSRPGHLFFSTTAVVMSEVIKFILSCFIVFWEEGKSLKNFKDCIKSQIIYDPRDNLLILIPGVLYMIQNNLLYISYSNLSPAVFQVSYQLKILTTAVFSRIMLDKILSNHQWVSLVTLFLGVASTNVDFLGWNPSNSDQNPQGPQKFFLIGISSVILACIISGAAGVYFEKLLKGTQKSVALRNIQLSLIGTVSGFISCYVKENKSIAQNGFFFGYDSMVWIVILLQSAGGLIVAAVVRYADTILKGYATSISIVITFILSYIFLHASMHYNILIGSFLVIAATIEYSYFPYKKPELPK